MDLGKIVKELIAYPTEANWFEFKENWYEPNGIGEYISSLSNATALEGKRVVVMVVPAASKIPTGFDGNRYLRIGSSKVNLNKYPERESNLFYILRVGLPTMCNTESEYQDLTFDKLFDEEAYQEAVINAFVHNQWTTGNAPMLTVFSDRIYGKVLQEQFKLNK